MNYTVYSNNSYGYGNNHTPVNNYNNNLKRNSSWTSDENNRNLLRGLNKSDSQTDNQVERSKSIIEESIAYSQSIRNSRLSARNTSNSVKKIKYAYRSVSMSILRAKTSVSAKMVVSKAVRVVSDLKRKLRSGKYDEDTLKLCIDHARAMERAARKKAKNLIIEEIADKHKKEDGQHGTSNKAGNAYAGNIEKADNINNSENIANVNYADIADNADNTNNTDNTAVLYSYTHKNVSNILDDMELMDMLEEYDITELMEEIEELNKAYSGMTKEEIAIMKAKHRSDEYRAIAKADNAYLKAVMEKLSSEKSGAVTSQSSSGITVGSTISCSGMVVVPSCTETVPAVSPGIDVGV